MLNPQVYLKFKHSLYQKRLRKTVYNPRQAGPSVTATGTENVHQNQTLSRCQAVRYYEKLLKQMVRPKTKIVHT